MIKISFCLRRRSGLSHEEFLNYWKHDHGALVQQYKDVLRIARYVQFHGDFGAMTAKLTAFRGAPEPYDGIAEIWYESRSVLETLGQDAAARAASRLLWEDEKRFVDLANSPIFAGDEIELVSCQPTVQSSAMEMICRMS